MRFIDISKLEVRADAIGWDAIRAAHLTAMLGLAIAERKEYINNHPDWNQFQEAMLGLENTVKLTP